MASRTVWSSDFCIPATPRRATASTEAFRRSSSRNCTRAKHQATVDRHPQLIRLATGRTLATKAASRASCLYCAIPKARATLDRSPCRNLAMLLVQASAMLSRNSESLTPSLTKPIAMLDKSAGRHPLRVFRHQWRSNSTGAVFTSMVATAYTMLANACGVQLFALACTPAIRGAIRLSQSALGTCKAARAAITLASPCGAKPSDSAWALINVRSLRKAISQRGAGVWMSVRARRSRRAKRWIAVARWASVMCSPSVNTKRRMRSTESASINKWVRRRPISPIVGLVCKASQRPESLACRGRRGAAAPFPLVVRGVDAGVAPDSEPPSVVLIWSSGSRCRCFGLPVTALAL
mmetsp:Transcript_74982/g.199972  ORF Transcript_74982/g.199972 Transcript_74982/m.199972 type:complete len:351 (-) Transcript_74982:305-1357(-)